MSRSWFGFRYYASWLVFGGLCVAVNLLLAPLLLLPRRERFGPFARRMIRGCLQFWLWWLHVWRIVEVRWDGWSATSCPGGCVYVANHPTLIDATLILARLKNAVCIFKPRLLRNPIIAPAALLAGYIASNRRDALRVAAAQVRTGCSLLLFPEGTRTAEGHSLNPLKPGFSLIARQANASVHVLRLRSSPGLLPRGCAWWRLPPGPMWVEITRDGVIRPEEFSDPRTMVSRVEKRLRHPPPPAVCLT